MIGLKSIGDRQRRKFMSDSEEKTERKIYKGEIKPAEGLAKALEGGLRAAPVQPMKRRYHLHSFEQNLPPSFVVTRFTTGYGGALTMHYYVPSTGMRAYREVPKDFELNHLTGSHAYKLLEEWNKAVDANLGTFTRRILCTIGTDPEVFVEDGKGRVFPAFSFLKSKDSAAQYKTGDGAFNGTYYWDGFQAEFTTPGYLTCLAQMSDTVQGGLRPFSTPRVRSTPRHGYPPARWCRWRTRSWLARPPSTWRSAVLQAKTSMALSAIPRRGARPLTVLPGATFTWDSGTSEGRFMDRRASSLLFGLWIAFLVLLACRCSQTKTILSAVSSTVYPVSIVSLPTDWSIEHCQTRGYCTRL
jgi:hypothetical protein